MDDYERVPVGDWSDVTEHLRELAGDGEASESDEGIEITVGNATFLVTRDGRVSAEMPLHDFEDGEVEVLYFDHDRGAVRVEDGDRSYEFRAPA
ncbi:hypothetical protein M0R89_08455 [Halorussus limi]|uniref:Halobacterial output domain-containing protein n=1 Tax=Halorussus limi TaxID=2938695 RepID=A0A8U0HZU5_9EURY|nr:hypothetical protein [Halorussus limi]UPV76074.1 hypothetical protein M0R89_08455 [Halorussus limi]